MRVGPLIAHRGFSSRAPENTRAAFAAAVAAGCHMIELDARLTLDGRAVVIHDDDLHRYGHRARASRLTLAALERLDAGTWFAPRFAGERFGSLAAVLAFVAGAVPVNVEVKLADETRVEETVEAVLDEVIRAREQVRGELPLLFSTFSPATFDRLAHRAPDAARALLVGPTAAASAPGGRIEGLIDTCVDVIVPRAREQGAEGLHVHRRLAVSELVEATHAAGLALRVYTVNDARSMRRLLAIGADGLFTDEVERLRKVLEEAG